MSLVEVSQKRSGENEEIESRFDQRETAENDDKDQAEDVEDIEQGSEYYYWIHISGLPPRCSYMQIKKITRDLLGDEKDLVTGEINSDTALICMTSQEAADDYASLLSGYEMAPECVLAAEVHSQAERITRFGVSRRTKIVGSKESSTRLAPGTGTREKSKEKESSGDNKQAGTLHRGGTKRYVIVKNLNEDASGYAWFRRFENSLAIKGAKVFGHSRPGLRWAVLECVSAETAAEVVEELSGARVGDNPEALRAGAATRDEADKEERLFRSLDRPLEDLTRERRHGRH